MSTEIEVLKEEIHPVVAEAKGLVIKDSEGMKVATVLLSKLNKFNDRVVEEREKVTKPLNEALRAERARWKPIETVNEEAIGIVREKMSEYQTAELKRQREEEAKIANRVGDGKGKIKIETAMKKMDEIKKVDESVNTDEGKVKFREDRVLKITDVNKIPREYMVVDEKKVLLALKLGTSVPGAEVIIKMVPLNFR